MRAQRVGHDWAPELTEPILPQTPSLPGYQSHWAEFPVLYSRPLFLRILNTAGCTCPPQLPQLSLPPATTRLSSKPVSLFLLWGACVLGCFHHIWLFASRWTAVPVPLSSFMPLSLEISGRIFEKKRWMGSRSGSWKAQQKEVPNRGAEPWTPFNFAKGGPTMLKPILSLKS